MGNQNEEKSLDVNGKTVEEAIERGLSQLGLSRDQVQIQVLNEGKRGLFGLGSEDAVVRLTPQIAAPAPQGEIQTPSPVAQPDPIGEDSDDFDEDEDAFDADDEAAEPATARSAGSSEKQQEVAEIASRYLATLLDHMGIQAQVISRTAPDLVEPGEEPPLVLDVTGNDLGILIGRRSETLQALQYMVRLMVSKELGSWQRIVVDVESYRSRRRRSLYQMAARMAERAVANSERVVLEAMTPYERRIIHIALRDNPAVITKSIGRDHNRKVTIIPKS